MRRFARIVFGALLAAGLPSCAPPAPDVAALLQADALAKSNEWAKAKPLLSGYMYFAPGDPGGHYLLARYYLAQATPYVTPAEEELKLARVLLEQGATPNALAEHYPGAEFSVALYKESTRAKLALARLLQERGAPPDGVLAQVNSAFEEALKGKRAHLDSPDMLAFFENMKVIAKRYQANISSIILPLVLFAKIQYCR